MTSFEEYLTGEDIITWEEIDETEQLLQEVESGIDVDGEIVESEKLSFNL